MGGRGIKTTTKQKVKWRDGEEGQQHIHTQTKTHRRAHSLERLQSTCNGFASHNRERRKRESEEYRKRNSTTNTKSKERKRKRTEKMSYVPFLKVRGRSRSPDI